MIDTSHLTPAELAELDRLLLAEAPILPHSEYRSDPVGWAVEKLGIPEHTIRWSLNPGYVTHQWDGTPDPLVLMGQALADWQNVGVESGTTTGKSFWAAILILWFLACHESARVFTFAPKEDQLKLYIWTELRTLFPRFQAWFPTAELTDLRLRMRGGQDDSWAAIGMAVGVGADEQSATKAQGMHAEHMLLVYEETPGIHPSILEAGFNTCKAPHNLRLAIGNPNHQLDSLHLFCQGVRTVPIRISALDHPNVVTNNANLIPGAVSRQSIEDAREAKGEASPSYQSRVRGFSPEQASDSLIRLEWLKAAAERWWKRLVDSNAPAIPTPDLEGLVSRNTAQYKAYPSLNTVSTATITTVFGRVTGKGVDVANSEHGDRACVVDFAGNACVRISAFACPDSNLLGAQVVREAHFWGLDGRRVAVDAIGVGAGTVNEARRQGYYVTPLYAGGKPMPMAEKTEDGKTVEWTGDVNQFQNLRSQMYWQAREDLRLGRIDLPYDKELWDELIAHTFEDQGKVTKILPKDDVKVVLGRSPDKADAFVMANWVRQREVKAKAPELEQGRTAGFDYKERRPKEKPSAEQELALILQRAQPNLLAGRSSIPHRRGR